MGQQTVDVVGRLHRARIGKLSGRLEKSSTQTDPATMKKG
jgi:hypothetical protein